MIAHHTFESIIVKHYPDMSNLTQLSGGLVSQTFSFQSKGLKYVFQIGGSYSDYEKQLYISNKYGSFIPVTSVISVHKTEDGAAYCFSHFIEGQMLHDLDERERREIALPTIEMLLKMSDTPIPASAGYGRFDSNGTAPYETWGDFISAVYDENTYDWSALATKGHDDILVRKAISELRENIRYTELDKPCLVHGDVGSYNIIALDGKISGLIDCGSALYGDPLYSMAGLLFWNEEKLQDIVALIKQRYYAEHSTRQRLYCYSLRIGLEEIYNTVVLDEIGYDVSWVSARIDEILMKGL